MTNSQFFLNPIVNFFGDNIYTVTLNEHLKHMQNVTDLLGIKNCTTFVAAYNLKQYIENRNNHQTLNIPETEKAKLIERGLIKKQKHTMNPLFDFDVPNWKHIGVIIGHITAFEAAMNNIWITNNNKPILFMEDDIFMDSNSVQPTLRQFERYVNELNNIKELNNWEFINLNPCAIHCEIAVDFALVENSKYFIDIKKTGMSCTQAYIMRNISTVHKIYSMLKPISVENHVLDDFFSNLVLETKLNKLNGYSVYPLLFQHHGGCIPWCTQIHTNTQEYNYIKSLKKHDMNVYKKMEDFRRLLRQHATDGNVLLIGVNELYLYYAVHEILETDLVMHDKTQKIIAIQYDFKQTNCSLPKNVSLNKINKYKQSKQICLYCVSMEHYLNVDHAMNIININSMKDEKIKTIHVDNISLHQFEQFATDILEYNILSQSFRLYGLDKDTMKHIYKTSVQLRQRYNLIKGCKSLGCLINDH